MATRPRWLGALALALALAAAPVGARAELRRLEVVGAVPIGKGTLSASRQAALQAALGEAALQAARGLFEAEAGGSPPEDLASALGAKPEDYAVSYRVVEDRGEQPALLTGEPPPAREYVVVAEVQVDLGRLRDRLRERGHLSGALTPSETASRFRLELLDLPSVAAYTAIRLALDAAGATLVPLELEPGRALVEVAGLPAAQAVERLRGANLPPGLWIEPLEAEGPGGAARVRVRRGAPPDLPLELEAPSPEGAPAAAPADVPAAAPEPAPN